MAVNASFVVWGLLFGWMLMPRIGKPYAENNISAISYVVALSLGLGFIYRLNYHLQVKFFLMGMIFQYVLYLIYKLIRFVFGKVSHSE
ncbi:hypothetical protein [Acetonema longum]|uniref:hypothetical protein n=1 Tax=Acetonema longum TaxID=2374 RepID=UPI00030511C6|nr:hypothetical protein [Acetonema longum]